MYRIGYSGNFNLTKDWKVNLKVEDRRFAFPDRQQNWIVPQIYVSRTLGNNWSAHLGFRYELTNSPNVPDKPVALSIPELRPFQGIEYKQKIQKLIINHRYRLKEIFERKNDDVHLLPGYDFNFRLSYSILLQYPLTKSGNLNVLTADEIDLNFGHSIVYNTFDKNDFYAGLNFAFSKHSAIELDYINEFQQKKTGDNYVARNILRMTFHQTIYFY